MSLTFISNIVFFHKKKEKNNSGDIILYLCPIFEHL